MACQEAHLRWGFRVVEEQAGRVLSRANEFLEVPEPCVEDQTQEWAHAGLAFYRQGDVPDARYSRVLRSHHIQYGKSRRTLRTLVPKLESVLMRRLRRYMLLDLSADPGRTEDLLCLWRILGMVQIVTQKVGPFTFSLPRR